MTLTKVETDAEFPLQDYHLMFDGNIPVGYGCIERPSSFTPIEWERKIDDLTDDLCDLFGDLYEDENGNLYGVEKILLDGKLMPCVWQRVIKTASSK